MARYFDEEWPKEEEILKIGLEQSKRHKRERMTKVFCIGNGTSRLGLDLETLKPHGKVYGCNAIYREELNKIDALISVDHGIMHEIYHAGIAQKVPCYFRDWTKVPAYTYEMMMDSGIDKLEMEELQKKHNIIITNERGDSTEYVMHGSKLSGIVGIIKKDGGTEKKNISHGAIKVSWIKTPDYSESITEYMDNKDKGWSAGPTAGWIACKKETPSEVFLIGHDLDSTHKKVNNIFAGTKHYVSKEMHPTPSINWKRQWKDLFQSFNSIKFYKVNRYNDGRDDVNRPIEEWKGVKNLEYIDYTEFAERFKPALPL